MSKKLTATQVRLVTLMRDGRRLMWFGDNGPELDGTPSWPQKRTVRDLLKRGVLEWGDYLNDTQRECGICPIVLTDVGRRVCFEKEQS